MERSRWCRFDDAEIAQAFQNGERMREQSFLGCYFELRTQPPGQRFRRCLRQLSEYLDDLCRIRIEQMRISRKGIVHNSFSLPYADVVMTFPRHSPDDAIHKRVWVFLE